MINFRYHLVSLIAVFLALAVGIVLGAGPLNGPISSQLSKQVDSLRSSSDSLRSDLRAEQTKTEQSTAFVNEMGPQVLADSLTGRKVALLVVDGDAQNAMSAVSKRFEQAGAQITARVAVSGEWWNASDKKKRSGAIHDLKELLPRLDGKSGNPDQVISQAIAGVLSWTEVQGATEQSNDATTQAPDPLTTIDFAAARARATVILTDAGIATFDAPTEPAESLVVVLGNGLAREGEDESPQWKKENAALLALVKAGNDKARVVVAGPASSTRDVIRLITSDVNLSQDVSTVEDPASPIGSVSTPLTLAALLNGQVNHVGIAAQSEGGTYVPKRLPAPEATATPEAPAQ